MVAAASTPINWWYVGVVAATAVVSSGVGGVLGVVGANRTNRANQQQLVTRLEHERAMAREERQQDRKGQAYVELLKFVHWAAAYFGDRRLSFVQHGDPTAGQGSEENRPSQESRDNVLALVTAFGSTAVQDALLELVTTRARAIASAEENYKIAKEQHEQAPLTQQQSLSVPYQAVLDEHDAFADAVEAIRTRAKSELRSGG